MGRKIPAKKHRGVKDPLVQQERRLQSLKSKINAPPKDPDEQPVPRSLTRLFQFNNTIQNNKTHKKKKRLKRIDNTSTGSHNARGVKDNPISRLRKLPGETGRDFSLRINSAIKALHNPTEPVDYPHEVIEEEDEKGARMAAQRERRARKHRRALRLAPPAAAPADPPPSRAQRRALRNRDKKLKALQAQEERREVVYERVAFGEVCDAPPALRFNRKLQPADAAPRPGRRDLLLTKMLSGAGGGGAGGAGCAGAAAGAALRRERARLDAVAAYRALKAQRRPAPRAT